MPHARSRDHWTKSRAWLLLEYADDERAYAGNDGYADEPGVSYVYDNYVPNHLRVQEGDLVLIADKEAVHGVARLSAIRPRPAQKIRSRCPVCKTTSLKGRKTLLPPLRCARGHVFAKATTELVDCTQYRAQYGGSYLRFSKPISVKRLRESGAFAPGSQLAIRALNVDRISADLVNAMPAGSPIP